MGECRAPARWFWQAVINRLRDRYRREAVAQKYREAAGRANPGLTSPDPDPDAGLIAEETRAEIERAIARLSSADQDLLRRLEAEEPYDSIAAATGRTVLAVKQAVYRARARVLDALNPELRDKILGRLAK
jgi:RNA polymerase sigma factor (sigma-70 family)